MALVRTRHMMPERPDYQQNDYIGTLRVTRAKREGTEQKHLSQMLEELEGH